MTQISSRSWIDSIFRLIDALWLRPVGLGRGQECDCPTFVVVDAPFAMSLFVRRAHDAHCVA